MIISVRRFKSRVKTNAFYYLRCGAKTITFLFWAMLYMVVMRLTIFKSSVNTPPKDWAIVPDNNTKWLFQGPVIGDDPEPDNNHLGWTEPENATITELENRAQKVQKVCRDHAIPTQPINSKEFFVDYDHNLVWCNIFKAASSTWLYKFNILGGYDKKFLERTKEMPLMLARRKFPRPSEEELRDVINTPGLVSFMIVREPFVRLLSAYRDKLEKITPPYYRKLAKEMVAENRAKTTKLFGAVKSFGPTFYEFVSYLIQKHKAKSFSFDEHWAPYYQFCTPCAANFTMIAKVESLSRDTAYVIHQLSLGHVLGQAIGNRRARLRTVMNKSKDGRNTTALLKYYFSQLDNKMLDGLLEIYGVDFEMFGYDSNVYRKYVRK